MCVANEHLDLPIRHYTGFDFKAVNSLEQFIDVKELAALAEWIIKELDANTSIKTRTLIRQKFNPSFIYNNYYKHILNEVAILSYSINIS